MIECWLFFSSSAYHFSNYIAIFSANMPHMILQPTDQFLPRRIHLPLTIIEKQQQREKSGEKQLSIDDFFISHAHYFFI